MIIGNGDMAAGVTDFHDTLIFVSGVSDSSETSVIKFEREYSLIREAIEKYSDMHLVYISSLSIYESNTPYTKHKINVENIVKIFCEDYSILRIGNITWGNNPKTIINFLKNKIKREDPYMVQDVYRNIIGKDELNYWIKTAVNQQITELNVTGERIKVEEIVTRIRDGRL